MLILSGATLVNQIQFTLQQIAAGIGLGIVILFFAASKLILGILTGAMLFAFHFPPAITFCFLNADQLLKCIPNSITCNRYRWVRILTKGSD